MSLSTIDWSKLELSKASMVKREVDVALQRLNDASTNSEINKSKLCSSIHSRIQELENFYVKNSDDERSILFEKERLRLRKALQSHTRDKDARSVNTPGSDGGAGLMPGPGHNSSNTSFSGGGHSRSNAAQSDRSISSHGAASSAMQSQTPSQRLTMGGTTAHINASSPLGRGTAAGVSGGVNRVLSSSNSFHGGDGGASNLAGLAKLPRSPGSQSGPGGGGGGAAIYAWEEGPQEVVREPISVDGAVFIPTPTNGIYSRVQGLSEQYGMGADAGAAAGSGGGGGGGESLMLPMSDKCIDFQIVLTQEELITLAARRKADRADVKLPKAKMAAKSVHSATPYIEQQRIIKEMYRPNNPDKWVDPAGMRAYKKSHGVGL